MRKRELLLLYRYELWMIFKKTYKIITHNTFSLEFLQKKMFINSNRKGNEGEVGTEPQQAQVAINGNGPVGLH